MDIFGSKNGQTKVEIEGVGPIWRDPRRNSAEPGFNIMQNGWMATQLVPKRCDFGSLGVPGPASTPLGPGGGGVGGSQTLKPRSKKVDFANYFIGFALQRGGGPRPLSQRLNF